MSDPEPLRARLRRFAATRALFGLGLPLALWLLVLAIPAGVSHHIALGLGLLLLSGVNVLRPRPPWPMQRLLQRQWPTPEEMLAREQAQQAAAIGPPALLDTLARLGVILVIIGTVLGLGHLP